MSFGLRIKWINCHSDHGVIWNWCISVLSNTAVLSLRLKQQQITWLIHCTRLNIWLFRLTVFCLLHLINNIQIFCLVLRYNPYQCVTLNQEQTPQKGIYACFRLHTFVAVYLFTFALCFLYLSFLVSDHQCREQEAPTSSLKSIIWSVLLR